MAAALAEHGAYVEPELLALVFGFLQRGVEAMQQLYGSLRFGLFIAEGVAEAQRGALTVTNETSSPSAPFRLNFKIAPETAALA